MNYIFSGGKKKKKNYELYKLLNDLDSQIETLSVFHLSAGILQGNKVSSFSSVLLIIFF